VGFKPYDSVSRKKIKYCILLSEIFIKEEYEKNPKVPFVAGTDTDISNGDGAK
jgi:hypothetical protein